MSSKILPIGLLLTSCAANPAKLIETPYYPEGAMTCEKAMDISTRVFQALSSDEVFCSESCTFEGETISPEFTRFDDESFISYFGISNKTQNLKVYPARGSFAGSCPEVYEYLNSNFFFSGVTR